MMISVREAQEKIKAAILPRPPQPVALAEAMGCFLAERILAPMDSPQFNNSAMDGYALRAEETVGASATHPLSLSVVATVSAGVCLKKPVSSGEAVRIFTGAKIPEDLNTVVKQEDVERKGEAIFLRKPVKAGENIRLQGEEIRAGQELLASGTALTPAAIALLASMGLQQVTVYPLPRVGILVTGSEIVPVGEPLGPAQIHDSNSFALIAALNELQLKPVFIQHCRDQKEDLRWAIVNGLEKSDFLIVTGGVSVGDFDFVKDAASTVGIQEIFWKVKQKPGKPIFFGSKDGSKFLFGLPGNPASALVCFYEYVRVGLLSAMGASHPYLPRIRIPLAEAFQKKSGLVHFLRSHLHAEEGFLKVSVLDQQGSHIMKSFAKANCLVVIPEETERAEVGTPVEVDLLPSFLVDSGGFIP